MKLIATLILLLNFVSCGKQVNSFIEDNTAVKQAEVDEAVAVNYEYEFSKRTCSTGSQVAKTFDEICHTLSDNELNNNCALEEREELFIGSRCPGVF